MSVLLWLVGACFAGAQILVPQGHAFAGTWPLSVYQSFGWQTFENVSLSMVTITRLADALALCSLDPSPDAVLELSKHVRGKIVAFAFPRSTTAAPSSGLYAGGCADELIISNLKRAQAAGFARFVNRNIRLLVPQIWWSCRNCSYFDRSDEIDFPVVEVTVGSIVRDLVQELQSQVIGAGGLPERRNVAACQDICPPLQATQCPLTSLPAVSQICTNCVISNLVASEQCPRPRCRGDALCRSCFEQLFLGQLTTACFQSDLTCAYFACGINAPAMGNGTNTSVADNDLLYPEVNVTISAQQSRYQRLGSTAGLALQIFFSLWNGLNLVMATVFGALQAKGGKHRVAVVALALEFLCALLRWPYLIVDPFYAWGFFPVWFSQIWASLFFSLSLLATFVIALAWFEASFTVRRKFRGLRAFSAPVQALIICFVVAFVLAIVAVEFVPLLISVFATYNAPDLLLARVIAQSILYWIVSAFFSVSGARILYLLHRSDHLKKNGARKFYQSNMAKFIIVDAALLTMQGIFVYALTID